MPVMIAKFCDLNKQHFAHISRKTLRVTEKPITQVVAEAIAYYMQTQDPPLKEAALGDAAGVSPRTVGNFLRPEKRQPGASGKTPSGKLTELEMIAKALRVSVADLVVDVSPEARAERQRITQAIAILTAPGNSLGGAPTGPVRRSPSEKLAA